MEHIKSKSNCTINELDEYSLLHIWSYLKPSDLINIAKVCRKWKQLSFEAWKNVSASEFYAFMKEQKTIDDVKKIFPYLKCISHITIAYKRHLPSVLKRDFVKLIHQILEVLSESETNMLRSFTWNVRVSRNLVQKFLKANIHNLEVITIDSFLRIKISADFNTLLQDADNLKEFNCYIRTDEQQSFLLSTLKSLPKTLRILRINILDSVSKPISAELVFKHLNHFQKLDNLVLYGLNFKFENKTRLDTTAVNLNLTLLESSVDYSFLPINPKLKHLFLQGGLLTNENLDFILKNYSSLQSIRLAYTRITDAQIGRLSELRQLKGLSLARAPNWTGSTLKFFPNLEELDFLQCYGLEEHFLFAWLEIAKNLKYLSLNVKEIEWDLLQKHLIKTQKSRIHTLTIVSCPYEGMEFNMVLNMI
ncbi:uncharacterized protein LOC111693954 [Trichogramma pretiosum]|uniref:uncharacterized protein LOC111693954 n=1 Tax=Trichogramma pretiosum TaxID=7493 RepID=UPI000C71AE5F|nr:uncharacterized protein LOC111693954 [Trichogramma pretiosum]